MRECLPPPTCHVSCATSHMSHIYFLVQSCETDQLRVYYQRGYISSFSNDFKQNVSFWIAPTYRPKISTKNVLSEKCGVIKHMNAQAFKEFLWALPLGTPSGKGLYLTVYPSSRPNTDTVWKPSRPNDIVFFCHKF